MAFTMQQAAHMMLYVAHAVKVDSLSCIEGFLKRQSQGCIAGLGSPLQ